MPQPEPNTAQKKRRIANVLAAFSLALTDKINLAVRGGSGRSIMASATLVQIGFNAGLSIEQLRSMIGLSHSATVRIIDQLVKDGLVVRERHAKFDSRLSSLVLTTQGRREMTRALECRSGVAERILEKLDEREIKTLRAILEKAIPSVVEFGVDQDVVCRLCDIGSCPQDICPVNTCVNEPEN